MHGTNCSGSADRLLPALEDLFNSCIRHKTVKYYGVWQTYICIRHKTASNLLLQYMFNEPKAHPKALFLL
jgi:hypothetical protein